MIIYIYCGVLTDGTPFSSAHAYKAGGGGSFFLNWIAKKPTATRTKSLGLELKSTPHILLKKIFFLFIIIIIDLKYDIFPYMRKYLYL